MGADTGTTAGGQENRTDPDSYVVTARWRLFVNETFVQRFVANMTVAKTDGSESRNIVIESIPTRPEIERNDVITVTELDARIHPNGDNSASLTAPVQLEIIGDNVIKLVLDIDERLLESEDVSQDILRSLEGTAIYGTIEFREIE